MAEHADDRAKQNDHQPYHGQHRQEDRASRSGYPVGNQETGPGTRAGAGEAGGHTSR